METVCILFKQYIHPYTNEQQREIVNVFETMELAMQAVPDGNWIISGSGAFIDSDTSTEHPRFLIETYNVLQEDKRTTETFTVTDDNSLLRQVEDVLAYINEDAIPGSLKKRRSFSLGGIIFVMDAHDRGIAGALWRLCEYMNQDDTQQIIPIEGQDV